MKIGDLVAVRFADCVVLGLVLDASSRFNYVKQKYVRNGYEVVYVDAKGRLRKDRLPRGRFISLRVRESREFVNLCELDWYDVQARDETKDGRKLREWTSKIDE